MALTTKPDDYTIAQYPLGMIRVAHMQKTPWHPLNDFSFIIDEYAAWARATYALERALIERLGLLAK